MFLPKDENLRLVYSDFEQDEVERQLRVSKIRLAVWCVLTFSWCIWFGMNVYEPDNANTDCYVLNSDAPMYEELKAGLESRGLVPCPDRESSRLTYDSRLDSLIVPFIVLIGAIPATLLMRSILLYRRAKEFYQGFLAFQSKYNRQRL